MGFKESGRVIYISICLLLAALVVYSNAFSTEALQKEPLQQVFPDVDNWKGTFDTSLDKEISAVLSLDDYLFRTYRKRDDTISLYIGYYRTTGKLGASHSPLVCFPGQGWELSDPEIVELRTDAGMINATTMVVKKGFDQQLILYWFQSYNMTSGGTFWQKVNNFWMRLNANPEDNAFVRVSAPIHDGNYGDAYERAVDFTRDFYPLFFKYITV